MARKLPASIAHYTMISAIGAGGMGEVYLAQDTKLDRQVALKVLLDEVAGDDERIRRFVQEAKAASALNHPNILTVYEIGEFEHTRYIATELIKGETLRDRLRGEPMALREVLDVAV
jgi:serine/threonine protein kinase